ncbi:hypothetical protein ACI7YT_12470 [Microbacterium sp. M]|uniref:hypothetical protein n=1 Tax=Microbacterium sp. M TaxID=3377125 RepID=UPI0038648F6A
MKTPGAIATDALTGYPLGHDLTREDAWQIVHDAIEVDRADREPTVRHIIFTGPFEEAYTMSEATRRIEELLSEGHETPTVVNAVLHDGAVVGLTARKIIGTAKAGEIR